MAGMQWRKNRERSLLVLMTGGYVYLLLALPSGVQWMSGGVVRQSSPVAEPGCSSQGKHFKLLIRAAHPRIKRHPGDNLHVNLTGPSWRPWGDDHPGSPCVNYETRLGSKLTRVLLMSYPCSGNSWLRYLLEGATGFFTGSLYKEKPLYEGGLLGEMEEVWSERTLVQKTHGVMFHSLERNDLSERYNHINSSLPSILLLRNPVRAIVSSWFLLLQSGSNRHKAQVDPSTFNTNLFRFYVDQAVSLWEEMATDRLLWSSKPVYVLHYEHLLQNTTHQLRRLLHFLSVPVDEGRLACVSSHLTGPFKRRGNKTLDPFTREEKQRLSKAVQRVNRLLLVLGYPRPPVYEELP
ncbi:WSC domain-containing protein 1-like [Homarus americanus]|uniref:WSC domain-containing protein 1-like n=1 Tax=Homarus americanus TaxID=6706 RepID=UPI001C46A732|nr:WSC domain-containing protein 1-like [Homarus americanus]